jgi:hypothetical protein
MTTHKTLLQVAIESVAQQEEDLVAQLLKDLSPESIQIEYNPYNLSETILCDNIPIVTFHPIEMPGATFDFSNCTWTYHINRPYVIHGSGSIKP